MVNNIQNKWYDGCFDTKDHDYSVIVVQEVSNVLEKRMIEAH